MFSGEASPQDEIFSELFVKVFDLIQPKKSEIGGPL